MGRRSGVFRASAFFRFNTVPPVNREKTSPYDQITSRDEVTSPFYVVGIGASAGGLAAFEAFFSGMSKGTSPGMAFVLVQHLAPNHKSLLAEIVGRYANLPVFEATDGVVVKQNCVYVIPPNHNIAIQNGALHLLELSPHNGQHLPIDYFFQSLAQELRERSIGIVLSGTGSDGTRGVSAIKEEGGFVIVQSPETTDFDGMPNSVIVSGNMDYILPPAYMVGKLIEYATGKIQNMAGSSLHTDERTEQLFETIFALLLVRTGHDFSHFKKSTILRRLKRRMTVHHVKNMNDYVHILQHASVEVDALFDDLLIGVTTFFRDPAAFEQLAVDVIPSLFIGKGAESPVRVWVTACSTGEEAYSIAILLQEQMDALKQNYKVHLFATDINSRSIETARKGIYSTTIAKDVSPERLAKYFSRESDGKGFRLTKNIRDMVIFSTHDVIRDPPFSKLDLISCRNLLIYMEENLQQKLISIFHYALNPGGMLFLGRAESITDSLNLFHTIDSKNKIYQRDDTIGVHRMAYRKPALTSAGHTVEPRSPLPSHHMPRELIERILLQKYAPVSLLVNSVGDIIYVYGHTSRFLESASGDSQNNILKRARDGLSSGLTAALHRAVLNNETVFLPGLRVKINGDFTTVNLTVEPVSANYDSSDGSCQYLVVLEDATSLEQRCLHEQGSTGPDEVSGTADSKISVLTQELLAKEKFLFTTNIELANSNENLKSVNEELQSLNEELQSSNEELDTSKEELQSVNEELYSVNAELHTKVIDLSQANNDMNNLLAGTGVGTVFVNKKLVIQRFTPAACNVINLIDTDVGRPLEHTVTNLIDYSRLIEDAQEVLDTLVVKNIEVKAKSGIWYLLCILPYRTLENDIEGVVLTFTDISNQVNARNNLQRLAVLVRDGYDAITVQDLEGRILAWNPAAEKTYGWSEAEALTMNVNELIPKHLHDDHVKKIVSLGLAKVLKPFRTQKIAKNGRIVEVLLTSTALLTNTGKIYAIATTEREIRSKIKGRQTEAPHDQ